MIATLSCITIGYFFGCINPATMIANYKNKNLKEEGTGNLGATNTMLVFGLKYGILVMLFDVFKSYFAVKISHILFPNLVLAGLLSGCFAVIGHIFPAHLGFSGGKGLAAFGGLFLAFDPALFLLLLLLGVACAFLVNYAAALPLSASFLAPVLAGLKYHRLDIFALLLNIGLLIFYKHRDNIANIKNGEEIRLREYLKHKFKINL